MIEKDISVILHRLNHLKRWHIACQDKDLEPSRIGQVFALGYIKAHPGCKQKEIADAFNLSRATVTKSIKRMLSDGLILREINEDDERKFKIYASQKGLQLTDALHKAADETDQLTFKGFSEEEKEMLKGYLDRMVDNLETNYSRGKSPLQLIAALEKKTKEDKK